MSWATVLATALPVGSSPESASSVEWANQSIGWKPQPPLVQVRPGPSPPLTRCGSLRAKRPRRRAPAPSLWWRPNVATPLSAGRRTPPPARLWSSVPSRGRSKTPSSPTARSRRGLLGHAGARCPRSSRRQRISSTVNLTHRKTSSDRTTCGFIARRSSASQQTCCTPSHTVSACRGHPRAFSLTPGILRRGATGSIVPQRSDLDF
jgi:hypothetical protein